MNDSTPEEQERLRQFWAEHRKAQQDGFLAPVRELVAATWPKKQPEGIDLHALKTDLDHALRNYGTDRPEAWRWQAKEAIRPLKKIRDHANGILSDLATVGFLFRVDGIPPDFKQNLERLAEFSRAEIGGWNRYEKRAPALFRPLSQVVGFELKPVFEKHFKRKASYTTEGRQTDEADGPFIRFCLHALNQYKPDPNRKKKVVPESIKSAWLDFKEQERE